ncbi:MAG: hypothetical protein COB76_06700 [Alphaproteobacteria bacterium]|nr:MAG: hypothetical protein COB76_06700 [Alphaproteobacteria bacterium]
MTSRFFGLPHDFDIDFNVGNIKSYTHIYKKKKENNMFDEEGRKIDLGQQIGMNLTQMSVTDLKIYTDNLNAEIKRVESEVKGKEASTAAADAFFK